MDCCWGLVEIVSAGGMSSMNAIEIYLPMFGREGGISERRNPARMIYAASASRT